MGQHRPRVLIVEDDTVFRRGLAHLFQANETEVIQASDGKRAQALIGDQRFDLVICDYWLPGVDGLSVLTRLKVAQPGTPFVLVTAHYSEEVLKESRARGGDAVLENQSNSNA